MQEFLAQLRTRRLFFFGLTLAAAIVLFLTVIILPSEGANLPPQTRDALSAVGNGLFGSIIATTAIAGFLLWVNPPELSRATMQVVHPKEIGPQITALRNKTNRYWFSGGTGNFTRRITLPDLARRCRDEGPKDVRIVIMDPRDKRVCQTYANYRAQARPGNEGRWSPDHVRNELVATIAAAAHWNQTQPRLRVVVGVRRTVSNFRLDFSDAGLVITREDPREPALSCDNQTFFFYGAYQQELDLEFEQVEHLDWLSRIPAKSLNKETVLAIYKEMGLTAIKDNETGKIVGLARQDTNPYG